MNYTIFGESHGPAIGVVLADVPAGIPVDEDFIAGELLRRATGKNALSTARKEADRVEFLSGVFQGKTTGTPRCSSRGGTSPSPMGPSATTRTRRSSTMCPSPSPPVP